MGVIIMNISCKGNPFCNSLNTQTRNILCKHVTVTYQTPKQIQSNQWKEQLEIIAEGVLLKYTLLEDGSQKCIELVKEGGLLGEHQLFKNVEYPYYHTMALTTVKKCIYPIEIIEKLFEENKLFAQVLLKSLSEHLANIATHSVKMHSKNGTEKIEYVYELLQDLGVDMTLITQEDLALIAGVSRITVARAMKHIFN